MAHLASKRNTPAPLRILQLVKPSAWQNELKALEAEQAADLASPELSWWPDHITDEATYYNQLATRGGFYA